MRDQAAAKAVSYNSQPFLFSEINEHSHCDRNHDAPEYEIAVFKLEFRQILKIGAVDTGDEGERNKYGGKNRQHLHDVVHAIADH